MTTLAIPIDRIIADLANQPRLDDLDDNYVRQLAAVSNLWPPITVVAIEAGRYDLVDGFNRFRAAELAGLAEIDATVVPMPPDGDLFRLAFEINASHGKPLTLQDRKAYARRLFTNEQTLSDREIARRAGLNHETVGAMRRGSDTSAADVNTRRPGELPTQLPLLDPIRFARATRAQKATAGYMKRLAAALADPYADDGVVEWTDDAFEIADAIFAAMGYERAVQLLEQMESDARFIIDICAVRLAPP